MLKVKEGIKLVELEKYGFEYKFCGEDDVYFERVEKGDVFITLDRRVHHDTGEDDGLYDLITAGIVVKEWLYELYSDNNS